MFDIIYLFMPSIIYYVICIIMKIPNEPGWIGEGKGGVILSIQT